MVWFARIGGTAAVSIISALLNGWAISCLWDWFIAALGAPHMPITSAIGMSIICQLLFQQEPKEASDRYKDCETFAEILGVLFIEIFITRLLAVSIGWIVTLFQ